MYVPPPRCRECARKISVEYITYNELLRDVPRSDKTIRIMISHRYPDVVNVDESASYVERLTAALEFRGKGDENFINRYDSIRTAPSVNFSHEEVCDALGVTKMCCKLSLRNPPIIPIYSPVQPADSRLQYDTGLSRRIVTRRKNTSQYLKTNYVSALHDKLIRGLFPSDAPRFSTMTGEEPIDFDLEETITNAIDALADDL